MAAKDARTATSAAGEGGKVIAVPPAPLPRTWADCDGLPTLVYWDIRGLAQAPRLALEFAGDKYADVRIHAGDPASDTYKTVWFSQKEDVGKTVPFPNLPYYIDADETLTQSAAILRHISRKYKFFSGVPGSAKPTETWCDFLLDQLNDFDTGLTRMCYGNYTNGRDEWVSTKMRPGLMEFERILETTAGPFYGGASVCAVDFKAYEEFDKCRIIDPGCLDGHATLTTFMTAFEAIPSIAAYLKSDRFKARPLNNPHAQFK
eukprot:m.187070 g.187070  ORF g.187070 m.187070 type:complete len:261 (-) comp16967_c0_seq1:22-804(-)